MAAIKHLLRYVAGTLDYGLFYPRGCGGNLGVLVIAIVTWLATKMTARAT
jgi:hypothetical protein